MNNNFWRFSEEMFAEFTSFTFITLNSRSISHEVMGAYKSDAKFSLKYCKSGFFWITELNFSSAAVPKTAPLKSYNNVNCWANVNPWVWSSFCISRAFSRDKRFESSACASGSRNAVLTFSTIIPSSSRDKTHSHILSHFFATKIPHFTYVPQRVRIGYGGITTEKDPLLFHQKQNKDLLTQVFETCFLFLSEILFLDRFSSADSRRAVCSQLRLQ